MCAGAVPTTAHAPPRGLRLPSRQRDPLVRRVLRRSAGAGDWGARALHHHDRWVDFGRQQSWVQVVDRLVAVAPSTVSVDVFDTVLVRRVVGDETLWWMVCADLVRRGLWSSSSEDFLRARRDAAAARPNGSLSDIYAQPVLSRLLDPLAGALVEETVEAVLASPVPQAAWGLEQLRRAGHQLIYISDMHLSSKHLQSCLLEHGLAEPGDRIVVSSEVGAAKWQGKLFPLLHDIAGLKPQWHVGNDLWADVAMAECAGVTAIPLRAAEPSALERCMSAKPGTAGAAIAGAARQVRVGLPSAGPVEQALREVGADVAGQCLAAFLLWVREQCEQAGVRDLAFLARDGELPYRTAQAMPADHWVDVHLRYLHGSRRLWSVAAAAVLGLETWLDAGTVDDAAFLRQAQNNVPFESLLGRLALQPQDLTDFPALVALSPSEPLPLEENDTWQVVLRDREIRRRIAARAARQHRDLRDHLKAQGLGRGRVALVDVGWRGQLAWHVSAVVRDLTGVEPLHLHFGGVDVALREAAQADIRRFAVDDSREALPFPDFVSCVETLTASGRPRAQALERDPEGKVRLIFEAPLATMDTEHRRTLWGSAVEVGRALPPRAALARWGLDEDGLDGLVRDVLRRFWLRPSFTHALAAANLGAEVDDSGTVVASVASPYRRFGLYQSSRTWRQGSLKLSPPVLRVGVRLALLARDALVRTFRRGRR